MTDWLARIRGGGPDFRLPDDPPDIPPAVFRERTLEYLAQVRSQARPPAPPAPDQAEPDQASLI